MAKLAQTMMLYRLKTCWMSDSENLEEEEEIWEDDSDDSDLETTKCQSYGCCHWDMLISFIESLRELS